MLNRIIIAAAFSVAVFIPCHAQKIKTIKSTKVTPYKPPVLTTHLGSYGANAIITPAEAHTLITLPLKVTDKKGNTYTVQSYQFLYRQKSVVQDENTGKEQYSFNTISDRFDKVPLPALWVKNITERAQQKDEEFYFLDIIVKDVNNRIMYAPALKLKIQ
jgi:hypothetical protein